MGFVSRRSTVAKNKKITFIGPGVMAEAMVAGLLREGLAEPANLLVSGPRAERGKELEAKHGIRSTIDNAEAARQANVLVLSIKPQHLATVLAGLEGVVAPSTLVLSIVAGAPMDKIATALKCRNVVRAMPNTPARIGRGITVWTATPEVSEAHRKAAGEILGALGEQVFVKEESFLDKATALSGTGPAYVFLFMEAMVDAGVHLGFPRRIAEQLVVETVRGSVDYYSQGDEERHLARLRNQVTSPGGTSAEALYYLEKAGFRTALSRAIWAAYERSRELGADAETHPPSG
jgi:pyrroline-5-carboxylate reductase